MATYQSTRDARWQNRRERGNKQKEEQGYLRQGYDAAADVVANRPAISLLTAWTVGFGLGLLIGYALGERPREERNAITRFGQNVLDAMSRCVPESAKQLMS